jgi:hypothetical protein
VIEPRVSLKRARELLAERGDRVGQSALSRYLSKYSDVLDPRRDGRETTVDFEALAKHRSENINRTESAATSSPTSVSVQRGRADEAALNIRAQRQMCELEIAERIGALTPTRWPRCAMPSRLRSTIRPPPSPTPSTWRRGSFARISRPSRRTGSTRSLALSSRMTSSPRSSRTKGRRWAPGSMLEVLSPLNPTTPHGVGNGALPGEGMDVERFTAELPGLAAGRQTLFDELARLAKPDVELTVSEHANLYRLVSPESGSPFPGPWRTDRVPYLREPRDCLHPDHPARRVTLKASAQTGKSKLGVNWFCFIVDRAPGPMLTVLPTGAEAVKYNRVKLQPTIDASPRIRHRVRSENSRDEAASTTSFKRFGGGFNQITTASSSKGLQMLSTRWLILDEVSGYLRDVDGRGSPSSQARARQKAFGDLAKELAISTPGVDGECEISDLYDASDRPRCVRRLTR